MTQETRTDRWGWLARFEDADALIQAVESLRSDRPGWQLEALTPFPLEDLPQALKLRRSPLPWIIFCGGVLGGSSIYALQYWVNLYAYPLNVGGRPLHSWPSFIPPTFEGTVMGASLFAIVGLMILCGLPRLHHPLFAVEAYRLGSSEGFFLAVRSPEEAEPDEVVSQLTTLGAIHTWEVPHA